jgi:hypothetical protein
MINNPDWLNPKIKPYHHQISLDCIKKLVDCVEQFNKGRIDADTTFKTQKQILTDEIEDREFLEFMAHKLPRRFACFLRPYT